MPTAPHVPLILQPDGFPSLHVYWRAYWVNYRSIMLNHTSGKCAGVPTDDQFLRTRHIHVFWL
jgi:hypothetical protein